MRWIALQWRPEAAPVQAGIARVPELPLPAPDTLGWWALQFTPRVAWLEETLLMEVSACERLWGGPRALVLELRARNPAPEARLDLAQGAASLTALAQLRLVVRGERPPADIPGALPLHTLAAALPHLDMLERLGCRLWADVERLPRAGLARRFGAPLRDALDLAWGRRPEVHRWLELPEHFEQKVELPSLAERAPELLWSASRLLRSLQVWLRARQRGVLALELQWTHDLRRFDGIDLPACGELLLRTAQPVQDIDHLQRLLGERLALQKLAAPASWLRLRSLETAAWDGASTSFLPEDNRQGDALHQLVERLSARLGEDSVLTAVAQADHRPDAMQSWQPARTHLRALAAPLAVSRSAGPAGQPDALYPGWLLPEPQPLDLCRQGIPQWRGPLSLVAGPQRVETGWWTAPDGTPPRRTVRDYYIAESPAAGLVWVFQERHRQGAGASAADRDGKDGGGTPDGHGGWFLHGVYA